MLKNQIKVLLQRVYNGGRKPKKIIMSGPMRDALRMELSGAAVYQVNTFPREDLFHGIPIIVAPGVVHPFIELEDDYK